MSTIQLEPYSVPDCIRASTNFHAAAMQNRYVAHIQDSHALHAALNATVESIPDAIAVSTLHPALDLPTATHRSPSLR